jgi:hypothetical protein
MSTDELIRLFETMRGTDVNEIIKLIEHYKRNR